MSDRLFLSCWLRRSKTLPINGYDEHGFDRERVLGQFAKMLGLFPFSMLSARGPSVRILAIDLAEPPLFERELPVTGDRMDAIDEVMAAAREFMQSDCTVEIDVAWDLWQLKGEWKLAPAVVTLSCIGPDFENSIGDHLRMEFASDAYFLPDPEDEVSGRMAESNLKSLVRLMRDVRGALELERSLLWSESGENPVERMLQALETSGAE